MTSEIATTISRGGVANRECLFLFIEKLENTDLVHTRTLRTVRLSHRSGPSEAVGPWMGRPACSLETVTAGAKRSGCDLRYDSWLL